MTNAERLKKLRAEAVANGFCYVCRCRRPRPGVKTCDECLKRGKEYQAGPGIVGRRRRGARAARRVWAKRSLDGLCIRCGKITAVEYYASCAKCLDEIANMQKARRDARRGGPPRVRRCIECGQVGHEATRHRRPGEVSGARDVAPASEPGGAHGGHAGGSR